MLLIIPISHADNELVALQADVLVKLGPYAGHHVTLIPTDSVPIAEAQAVKAKLEKVFDSVVVYPVVTKAKVWAAGPNEIFQHAAAYAVGREMPWWMFEGDLTPLRAGWLTACHDEYQSSGKAYWGRVVPTRVTKKLQDGTVNHTTAGEHMVGCAIYHPEFATKSLKLPNLNRRMVWARGTAIEPFDIALRDELVPWACRTELLQHNFKTANYRQDGDRIICDNLEGNPEHLSHAKPVDPRAVVVHGCKDGSLARLILGGVTVSKSVPVHSASSGAAASGGNDAIPSSSTAPEVHGKEPATANGEAKTAPSFLAFKIQKLLADGTNRRVKQAAKDLDLTEEVLRATVAEPTSGLRIVPPGWVKLKGVA